MYRYNYQVWPEAVIFAGKSFVFFGLFLKTFAIKASYWFWGSTVVLTIAVMFIRLNEDINQDKRAKKIKDKEAIRNTKVICAQCDRIWELV